MRQPTPTWRKHHMIKRSRELSQQEPWDAEMQNYRRNNQSSTAQKLTYGNLSFRRQHSDHDTEKIITQIERSRKLSQQERWEAGMQNYGRERRSLTAHCKDSFAREHFPGHTKKQQMYGLGPGISGEFHEMRMRTTFSSPIRFFFLSDLGR